MEWEWRLNSVKTLEQGDVLSLWVGEHSEVLGGDAPGKSLEASFSTLHHTAPSAAILFGCF